jgi:translation initiation factor 3 subunit K
MGAAYDFAPERPEHIQQILDGLDRYNPETTGVFQDYVMQQCESQTYDCYANLALLKLYVGHLATTSHMSYDEQRTTMFPINRGMEIESLRPLKFIISSI